MVNDTPPRRMRLYGVFMGGPDRASATWALGRNKRKAIAYARRNQGLVLSMILPYGGGAWDAPTFRACADRVDADFRNV